MSSMWGNKIKISIFGESHGEAVGVTIDGLPSGVELDEAKIASFMLRRSSRGLPWATARQETDNVRILSGFYQGRTTGAPLCAMIGNVDKRSADYELPAPVPRPGHADLTATAKYSGYQDPRGGGHFSGRLTAPLAFAGAVCRQILEKKNIRIFAHVESIGTCSDVRFDSVHPDLEGAAAVGGKDFPVLDDRIRDGMIKAILTAKEQLDSVGGIVECMACGIPAGLGEPMFDSVESRISSLLFGIPAVKGVEFGSGFGVASLRGSENNDVPYYMKSGQRQGTPGSSPDMPLAIRYRTNHAGGIEGGITNGMPVLFRAAFKPTPSIAKEQDSIDLEKKENIRFRVEGRHDPCIVPRAVPVVEAVCAIAILDLWMECFGEG